MSTVSERVISPSRETEFEKPTSAKSLWSDAFMRLKRNRLAISSLGFIIILAMLAIFAPLISPYDYATQDYDAIRQSPNWNHPLGTDQLGRDILSRLLFGARISLAVGITVQFVIVIIGVPAGIIAGFYGGKTDTIIMRIVDILYAMPSLLFVIIIMTFLQGVLDNAEGGVMYSLASANNLLGGLVGVFIGLGLISWLTVARIVRSQSMSLKNKEYVEAARSIGATNRQIMTRHILSNTMAPIVVAVTLGIPLAIIYEAGISFLGLGVRPPMPSWGLMISEAIPNLRSYPYMLLAPAAALSLTVLAFNFLGDGIRDAFDPWMKR